MPKIMPQITFEWKPLRTNVQIIVYERQTKDALNDLLALYRVSSFTGPEPYKVLEALFRVAYLCFTDSMSAYSFETNIKNLRQHSHLNRIEQKWVFDGMFSGRIQKIEELNKKSVFSTLFWKKISADEYDRIMSEIRRLK